MPTAIVFDLDGTLIDSAPDLCHAVNVVLRSQGRGSVTVEETRDMTGSGARLLLARAFARTGEPASEALLDALYGAFLDAYAAHLVVGTAPYPGVLSTVEALSARGVPMAICTNKPTFHALEVVARLGLDRWFEVVVGGDDAPRKKPDPALVIEALRRLGKPAAGSWMVGDSNADIGAARAAGLVAVAVSWGYHHGEELQADHTLAAFPELLTLLG